MVEELPEYTLAADEANAWTILTYQKQLEKLEDFWAVKRTKMNSWTEFAHTCMLLTILGMCGACFFHIEVHTYGSAVHLLT